MKKVEPEKQGFLSQRLSLISETMNQFVHEGKLAGISTLVARKGEVVHLDKCGYQNIAEKIPLEYDTLFRIYSMTKPITTVAFMMLYEQNKVRLTDAVSKYIPEFKQARVLEEGGKLVPPRREITTQNLLTHTAGFSYGDDPEHHLLDRVTAQANLDALELSNEELSKRIARIPLRFHPGEGWHYSLATDVLGYIIELISGMTLTDYFNEKIFTPLGMDETFFRVPKEKASRLSELYGLTPQDPLGVLGVEIGGDFEKVKRDGAGAGLVSKLEDYHRFTQFLLNKGELDGVRLLGPRTVELMRTNHLPKNLLPINMGDPWPGIGFGLGVSVLLDPTQSNQRGSVGSHGWGGWASTHFWVDPIEEIIGILMLQYIPSGTYTIVEDFRNLVYQALIV